MRQSRRRSRKNKQTLIRLATTSVSFLLMGLVYAIAVSPTFNEEQASYIKRPSIGITEYSSRSQAGNIKRAKAKALSNISSTEKERLASQLADNGSMPEDNGYTSNADANTGDYIEGDTAQATQGSEESNSRSDGGAIANNSRSSNKSGGNGASSNTKSSRKGGSSKIAQSGGAPAGSNAGSSTPSTAENGAPGSQNPSENIASNPSSDTPSNPKSAIPGDILNPGDTIANNPPADSPSSPERGLPGNSPSPDDTVASIPPAGSPANRPDGGTPKDIPNPDDQIADNPPGSPSLPLIPEPKIPNKPPKSDDPVIGGGPPPAVRPPSGPVNQGPDDIGDILNPEERIARNDPCNDPMMVCGTDPFLGPLIVDEGIIVSPGHSPGTLPVTGDYILDGGLLEIEFAGLDENLFDMLDIAGDAIFESGTIEFSFIYDFMPSINDSFDFLFAKSITGFDLNDPTRLAISVLGLSPDLGFIIEQSFAGDGREKLTFKVVAALSRLQATANVPEPATLSLVCFGLAGLGYRRRLRRALKS